MNEKRIVITGLGVISSNGIGKNAFFEAISNGVSGIKPISSFDTTDFKVKTAGEIKDFVPQDILGPKGLRTLGRSTKLICSAAKLALDDASLEITKENTHNIGVVVGTTLGSISSISDFDREAIIEGPRYVNPALFPNTVINSPASEVSIKFNIKGFNATVSTGFTAGLDAINYALDFLRLGRVDIVLAGGVEEFCIQIFLGFYKSGCLAGSKDGSLEISCPFDRRRNGVVLAEGSSILVLEDLDSALRRKARIYAEVLGFGVSFDTKEAMCMAVRGAGLKTADIDYICAGANSSVDLDLMETQAISDVFSQDAQKIGISSVKSMIGECFSASGSLQLATAVAAIDKEMIPPNINYAQKDEKCNLNYVVNKAMGFKVNKVLVNALGPLGHSSSLVIARFNK